MNALTKLFKRASHRRSRVFFDCEFTSLTARAQLISIAFLNERDDLLYFEFDFDRSLACEFVKREVIPALEGLQPARPREAREQIFLYLVEQGPCELWGFSPAYDWVFLNDFMQPLGLPANVYPRPFDLNSVLLMRGIDPHEKYTKFKDLLNGGKRHNAKTDVFFARAVAQRIL